MALATRPDSLEPAAAEARAQRDQLRSARRSPDRTRCCSTRASTRSGRSRPPSSPSRRRRRAVRPTTFRRRRT
jgi:hypothetical protein